MLILFISLILNSFIFTSSAVDTSLENTSLNKASIKLSENLMDRYEDIDQESKITVSIWTNDIDADSILKIALTECDVDKKTITSEKCLVLDF